MSELDELPRFPNCECVTWCRVDPIDLRGGQHHHNCKHYKPSFYVRVKLRGGGSYTIPLSDLGALQADLEACAENDDTKAVFEVSVVDMTPLEYARLPEFTGH